MNFLADLFEHEPPRFHWQRFADTEHADEFQHLISIGVLRHADNATSICCRACDTLHSAQVEFLGGGRYRTYCPDVGYYDVVPEQLRVFEPDLLSLTKKMARGLGIPARIVTKEIIPKFLYELGKRKFGPYASRVYFARCLDRKERFDQTHTALVQISDRSPVLILSTTLWEQTAGTLPARHAILWLPHVATFDGDALSFEHGPFLAKLRGDDAAFRAGGIGFAFSPGFRWAAVGDQEYGFTSKQAEVVEALYNAFTRGLRKLHQTEVMGFVDSSQRVGQLFRGHPAYGTLIQGDDQGYYWLNL